MIVVGGFLIFIQKKNDIKETRVSSEQSSVSLNNSKDNSVSSPVSNTAPSASSSGVTSYTLSDVAKHSTTSDCWTVVNKNVYNLSSFVYQHPGGVRAISSLCGKDGTETFTNQHGGQSRPENELASLKIGVLK